MSAEDADAAAVAAKILKEMDDYWKALKENTKGMEDMDKWMAKMAAGYQKSREEYYRATKAMGDFIKKQEAATRAMHEQKEAQTRETIRRQQHYFDEERSLTDYRHSFEDFDNALNTVVNAFTGKLSIVGAFKAVATTSDRITKAHDKMEAVMGKARNRMREMWEGGARNEEQFRADPKMGDYINKQEEIKNTLAGLLEGQKIGNQTIGDRLEGAKEYFKKHAVGIALSVGAAAVIFAVLKKALEVSPMFQQMLKLLKFGIMMILRPIGDFFGFVMRPILLILLRKFIIPWYTTMYPKMIKWGNDIGVLLAGAIGWISQYTNVGQGVTEGKSVIKGDDPFLDIVNPESLNTFAWLEDARITIAEGAEGLAKDFEDFDILGRLAGLLNPFPDAAGEDGFGGMVGDWFQDGLDNAYANFSSFYFVGIKWFKDGLKDAEVTWGKFFDGIKKWWDDGLETIDNTDFAKIWTGITDWFTKGLENITITFSDIWDAILEAIRGSGVGGNPNSEDGGWDPLGDLQDMWASATGGANGLQINEPILGVGRSGKAYKFGERGSETVVPNGGGMGSITINIENMSGSQQDLNNLRQTILSVVQEANTRRGRI